MVGKTEQNSVILIGRTDCDADAKYPFFWCEEIIKHSKENGFNVIDLKKDNFIEEKFNNLIKKNNPQYIFLNGHGLDYSALGYQKNPVLIMNKNDHLLNGKIVHAVSCSTAKYLGQYSIDKGCKGYIGYRNIFYVPKLTKYPVDNLYSNMLMAAVNITSKTLIEGGTIQKAYENSQKVYQEKINKCLKIFWDTSEEDLKREYCNQVMCILIYNKRSQTYFTS